MELERAQNLGKRGHEPIAVPTQSQAQLQAKTHAYETPRNSEEKKTKRDQEINTKKC